MEGSVPGTTAREKNVHVLIQVWSTTHGSSSKQCSKVRKVFSILFIFAKSQLVIEQPTCTSLYIDKHLKDLFCQSRLAPISSTKVCAKCYDNAAQFHNTNWLTWLECGHVPHHDEDTRVTLTTGENEIVALTRELPQSLEGCHPQDLALCEEVDSCPDRYNCNRAHCIEELEYWKWSLVHRKLEEVRKTIMKTNIHKCTLQVVPNYRALKNNYSYSPNEAVPSASQGEQEVQELVSENYVTKFHKLICLDEIAHSQKMA